MVDDYLQCFEITFASRKDPEDTWKHRVVAYSFEEALAFGTTKTAILSNSRYGVYVKNIEVLFPIADVSTKQTQEGK